MGIDTSSHKVRTIGEILMYRELPFLEMAQ